MGIVLGLNFDATPDYVKPIAPGVYVCRIDEAPVMLPNNNKDGQNLVVKLVINDDGEYKDRQLTYYVSDKSKSFATDAKRVFLACGIRPSTDTSTDELVGKTLRAAVISDTYTKDGVTKETSKIGQIIVPEEMIQVR